MFSTLQTFWLFKWQQKSCLQVGYIFQSAKVQQCYIKSLNSKFDLENYADPSSLRGYCTPGPYF